MNKLIKKNDTVKIITGSRKNQIVKVLNRRGDNLILDITKKTSKKTVVNYAINISNVVLVKT